MDLEYCGMWWLVFATVLNQSLLQTQMDRRKPLMNTAICCTFGVGCVLVHLIMRNGHMLRDRYENRDKRRYHGSKHTNKTTNRGRYSDNQRQTNNTEWGHSETWAIKYSETWRQRHSETVTLSGATVTLRGSDTQRQCHAEILTLRDGDNQQQ